jgi:hypothetical protein
MLWEKIRECYKDAPSVTTEQAVQTAGMPQNVIEMSCVAHGSILLP